MIGAIHERHVRDRRARVLADVIANVLPRGEKVIDVGSGDGRIGWLISAARPDLEISGIDVLLRPHASIPTTLFDGSTIPFPDGAFDTAMFVDVLHHTEDPMILLREARRVARRAIVIKDHCRDGFLADTTLRFMDWVGNARHGVALPFNYWPEERWRLAAAELGLIRETWRADLGLYAFPMSLVFERGLHFVTRLVPHRGHALWDSKKAVPSSRPPGRSSS